MIDPQSADEVRRCFAHVRDGRSLPNAAAMMATETGRPWMASTVAGIVGREAYKHTQPGRIVDPRVWNGAQASLAARRKR